MNSLLATAAAVLLVVMVMVIAAIFTRGRRAAAAVQPSLPEGWEDRHFAAAHGIPLSKWNRLSPKERTALRLSVAHAIPRQSGDNR